MLKWVEEKLEVVMEGRNLLWGGGTLASSTESNDYLEIWPTYLNGRADIPEDDDHAAKGDHRGFEGKGRCGGGPEVSLREMNPIGHEDDEKEGYFTSEFKRMNRSSDIHDELGVMGDNIGETIAQWSS